MPQQTRKISAAEQQHIGAALRTYRQLRDMRIGELANAMVISYAYLANIEAGRKRLTSELADRAVAALGIERTALVRADLFDDEERAAA